MKYEIDNIYCVDAYKAIKDIPDKSVDLIVTDPPYQIESLTGGKMVSEGSIANVMKELGEYNLDNGISNEILNEFLRVCKKPNIYIWCNKTMIPMLMEFFVIKHDCAFDIITWHKTNAMPLCGGKYLTDTEYCLYFRDGVKLNTTYETASTHYEIPINILDKNKFSHPTIKPMKIIQNLILNSTNENDIVFDPFIGSGTTAVAAKNLNRHYIGFEIEKKWCDIAKNRLENILANGQMTMFTM